MPTLPGALVIKREEAETYWQPAPSHGCMNIILSPRNCPSNAVMFVTQYIDEGCLLRPHAHAAAEEILFFYEGHGTFTIDGQDRQIGAGTTAVVGRYVRHCMVNKASGPLKLLAVLFPPGTESAWRAMGKPRKWGDPPPPRYGREEFSDLPEILSYAQFATPAEIDAASPSEKGVAVVVGPEEGLSFWQPEPTGGYVTRKLGHANIPSNMFAMGTQVMPPGGRLGPHANECAEEILFVLAGRGLARIDGVAHAVEPETLIYVGRDVMLELFNHDSSDLSFVWVRTPPGKENIAETMGIPRRPSDAAPAALARPANWRELYRRAGLFCPPD